MNEDREERERGAMAMHLWQADLAAETGMAYEPIAYAWTGEFREDGALIPREGSRGFSIIPAYFLDGAVGDFDEGFVVRQLFYSAHRDSYAVVEVMWNEEPEPPAAYPIGKPRPEGTAPLRYLDGEESDGTSMVAWASDVPRPLSCRTYPKDCATPAQWLTEGEARGQFPHLFREEGE